MSIHMPVVSFLIFLFVISARCANGEPPFTVIIIGAGPSGIAAATRLLENNINNIVVLEAEGRIGGRVNTVHVDGSVIELGAEWCHGQEGNLVYEMANKYNLLRHENEQPFDLLYSNGEKVDDELKEEVGKFILEFAFEEGETSDDEASKSFGEHFLKRYEETILEKYKKEPKKLKFAVDAISTAESFCLAEVGAFSWYSYPPASHFQMAKGDQAMVWNGVGYETILEIMMKTYEHSIDFLGVMNRFRTYKRVTRIEWLQEGTNSKVVVRCEDKSSYTADHVIFTPSLGVLKEEHEKIFRPALPPEKQQAISKLGFDGVMKIISIFNNKWWKGEFVARPFIWTSEDKANMPYLFPQGPVKDNQSWITHVYTVHVAENNPNAIVAWITGDIILELEQASLPIIEEGMMYILRKFLGNMYNITQPDKILHSSWCTNPHFRGTYSYETVASRETDVNWNQILSDPLYNYSRVPVLLFAGEATNSAHYSTVHGAIESGYREADRLLGIYGITKDN